MPLRKMQHTHVVSFHNIIKGNEIINSQKKASSLKAHTGEAKVILKECPTNAAGFLVDGVKVAGVQYLASMPCSTAVSVLESALYALVNCWPLLA